MKRILKVNGLGTATAAPDTVVVTVRLKETDMDYGKALDSAEKVLCALKNAVISAGFSDKALKTSDFSVNTEYESQYDDKGSYKNVFCGYSCSHTLKTEFDFDTEKLKKILSAITGCIAQPDMNIYFTVKDKSLIQNEMLKCAADDARRKALILAEASGVTLGELLSVCCDSGNNSFRSVTEYGMNKCCTAGSDGLEMDFTPEDIILTDTVIFVWEIK